MRTADAFSSRKLLLLGSAGVMAIGLSCGPAHAQLFCPAGETFGAGGCTVTGGGAFSTAALSSQALSEVSQLVTQQSTEAGLSAVRRRTEQERVQPQRPAAPAPTRRAPRDPKSPDLSVYKAPVAPGYVGPTYAVWTQGFGDWEKRDENTSGLSPLGDPAAISFERKMTTWGILGGADVTFHNGPAVWVLGVFTAYTSSDVKFKGSAIGSTASANVSFSTVDATISGPSVGAYASFASGPWSADLTLKVDFFDIDQSFFEAFPVSGQTATGSASVDQTNFIIAGNLNYRVPLSATHWWEPTAGFRYTNVSFGSNAAVLGLDDGSVFRLQGGVRFGWEQYWSTSRVVTTLTGLLYSDVSVDGLVLNTGGFVGNAVLPSDEGKVRVQGILAFNFDHGTNITSFVAVDVRGGEDLIGAGGRVGFRVRLN